MCVGWGPVRLFASRTRKCGAEALQGLGFRRGCSCEMEVDAAPEGGRAGLRERRGFGEAERPQQNHEVRSQSGAALSPKHSYWLDLWLFVLFDVILFFFVYFLP
ncbi:uncharacterized protein C4orf3 homolog [Moschus berezovskii]|uniref:Uncharacterized protein n=1 Tax=Moschus moschiferus TaxID=68415 RepID=A0A8C6DXP0_MOSMO|nr:uncharacterized protein C4orf3 homolog [Moschus berezovskii]